jgi:hypothetical protein
LFNVFLLAGILGAATTIVAMEYYLFSFDKSSAWKKSLWFLVMCFPFLGPALHCLIVYSRATAPVSEKSKAAVST